jgi:hypothetical protein
MKLIDTKQLTPEQRQKLAAAALKARPTAQVRAEFRRLTQCWHQCQRIAGVGQRTKRFPTAVKKHP